jgi:hypothetical protein
VKKVSGLGISDDNGHLVGHIGAADLKVDVFYSVLILKGT